MARWSEGVLMVMKHMVANKEFEVLNSEKFEESVWMIQEVMQYFYDWIISSNGCDLQCL